MSAGRMKQQQDSSTIKLSKTVTDSVATDSVLTAGVKKAPFRFVDAEPEAEVINKDSSVAEVLTPSGPGLFKDHLLRPIHQNARPINDFTSDWFTIVLIALVGLFTWFRFFYYRIFRQLLSACFNNTVTNQIVRDESVLLQRASLVLSVISYLLAGLFLYQLSVYYNWQITWLQNGIVRFAMFAVAIASAYSIKMVSLRFLSAVFSQERPVAIYIFNIFLMVMMAGIILLPVNILLAYAPAEMRSLIIGVALLFIGLLYVYRLVRATGIWIGIPGFSFLYLFLYLCTFEIAPLLIIYKLAVS